MTGLLVAILFDAGLFIIPSVFAMHILEELHRTIKSFSTSLLVYDR